MSKYENNDSIELCVWCQRKMRLMVCRAVRLRGRVRVDALWTRSSPVPHASAVAGRPSVRMAAADVKDLLVEQRVGKNTSCIVSTQPASSVSDSRNTPAVSTTQQHSLNMLIRCS